MLRYGINALLLTVACAGLARAGDDWVGEFTISSSWNRLAIDVPEGKRVDGLDIIQWERHGRDAQKWRIEAVDAPRGWHRIVNAYTEMVLDIKDASKEDRAILIQGRMSEAKSQHWRIDRQVDGTYKILSRWSGKAIDIPFGSREPGTTLELAEDNNQPNQRWVFRKAAE
jgi:hypothetical protein